MWNLKFRSTCSWVYGANMSRNCLSSPSLPSVKPCEAALILCWDNTWSSDICLNYIKLTTASNQGQRQLKIMGINSRRASWLSNNTRPTFRKSVVFKSAHSQIKFWVLNYHNHHTENFGFGATLEVKDATAILRAISKCVCVFVCVSAMQMRTWNKQNSNRKHILKRKKKFSDVNKVIIASGASSPKNAVSFLCNCRWDN